MFQDLLSDENLEFPFVNMEIHFLLVNFGESGSVSSLSQEWPADRAVHCLLISLAFDFV